MAATALMRLLPAAARRVQLSLTNSEGQDPVVLELDVADPTQFSMVKNPQLDLMTASIVYHTLGPGDTYVDVGTNWGYFAAIASKRVGHSGLVVGLEASRKAYATLLDTLLRHNLGNVAALNYAAAECEGRTVSVVRPFYRQTGKSYVRESDAGSADAITTTVDYLVGKFRPERVKLIKIDAEGADLLVLKGARSTIQEHRPYLVVEVSDYSLRFGYQPGEVYEFMESLGFQSSYMVRDDASPPSLEGPLETRRTGQIFFCPPEMQQRWSRPRAAIRAEHAGASAIAEHYAQSELPLPRS